MATESKAFHGLPAAAWLAAIVDSSDDAIVSKTLEGTITSWNPAAEKLFGYTAEEAVGRHISMLAAPGHESEMPGILQRLRRGEKIEHFEAIRRRKDGALLDVSLTISPIHDDTGRIVGASKIARDISERKRAEERQRILAAELSHRVKNNLAVVQALAERTAEKASSIAGFLEAFRGRLQALSSAHQALIAGDWRGASLAALVHTALDPYLGDGDRLRLEVQDLALRPDVAPTLALGIHELATNAAKYGALASTDARVSLTVRREKAETGEEVHLIWQEDGGPPARPPEQIGFGLTMLSRAIEYQHRGRVELTWREEGLLCRIVLPAAEVVVPQT